MRHISKTIAKAMAVALLITSVLGLASAAAQSSPMHKMTGQAIPGYGIGYWPGNPELCVLDRTDEMPVAEAVAEFERTAVTMTLEPDCGQAAATIILVPGEHPDDELAGWTDFDADTAWITLNTDWNQGTDEWRQLIVHELGHAVGLEHTNRVDSIMNRENIYEHSGLTDTDVAVINSLYSPAP